MPRSPKWILVVLLAVAFVASPRATRADDLIPPKTLVRKFPQGVFCTLPISLSFTAPSVPVIVTFTAVEWVNDDPNGLKWTQQLIDNVTVAPTSQVAANYVAPPAGSSSEFCYIGDPQPSSYFHFNRSGLELDLLERFDTNPAARGWSLGDGAYFVGDKTAARDVENEADFTGGSLGLGNGTGVPSASKTASTSITLDNLNNGVSYDLGAWWYAGFVHFPHDVDYLTVTITTLQGVPVAKRSWGSVKREYR